MNPSFKLSTLIRIAVGVYFIYAAYSKILNPADVEKRLQKSTPAAVETQTPAAPSAQKKDAKKTEGGPRAFAKSVNNYQILPSRYVNITAVFLPWLELVCGLALILIPPLRGAASILTIGMLLVFTGALGWALHKGLDISCGCTAQDGESGKVGIRSITRNIMMIFGLIYAGLADRWTKQAEDESLVG